MVDIYIYIEWLTKYNNLYEIKFSSYYIYTSSFSAPLCKSVAYVHMQFSTKDPVKGKTKEITKSQ